MIKGGISYAKLSFIALDIAVLSLIAGVLFLFFKVPLFGWVLLAVGGLGLLFIVGTYNAEFRWRYHHDQGIVLYQRGNYEKAAIHFHKSAESARKFALNDNRIAQELNNLAAIYLSWGREKEAEQLYKESLAVYERSSGPGPNRALEVRHNLERINNK